MKFLALLTCLLLLQLASVTAFSVTHQSKRITGIVHPPLTRVNLHDNEEEDILVGKEDNENDGDIMASLLARRDELERGIGRRYITRTQKGFLNIHSDCESGPYALENIVGQLSEGRVVTSIQNVGGWIKHDAGGWSISKFGGFTWLEPIEE